MKLAVTLLASYMQDHSSNSAELQYTLYFSMNKAIRKQYFWQTLLRETCFLWTSSVSKKAIVLVNIFEVKSQNFDQCYDIHTP